MKCSLQIVLCLLFLASGYPSSGQQKGAEDVKFCDLIATPEKYDGARVSVYAVYNYGFEWQELLCMECRKWGQMTWLEFSVEHDKKLRKQMRKAPKDHGFIAARFTGVFRRRGHSYGGYTFEFEVEDVSGVRVLIRDYKTPLSSVPSCCKLFESESRKLPN